MTLGSNPRLAELRNPLDLSTKPTVQKLWSSERVGRSAETAGSQTDAASGKIDREAIVALNVKAICDGTLSASPLPIG